MTAVDDHAVSLAIDHTWRGDAADWPHTALQLVQAVGQRDARIAALQAELDELRGVRDERQRLWIAVEGYRHDIRALTARLRTAEAVVRRAEDIREGRSKRFGGLVARLAARYILELR